MRAAHRCNVDKPFPEFLFGNSLSRRASLRVPDHRFAAVCPAPEESLKRAFFQVLHWILDRLHLMTWLEPSVLTVRRICRRADQFEIFGSQVFFLMSNRSWMTMVAPCGAPTFAVALSFCLSSSEMRAQNLPEVEFPDVLLIRAQNCHAQSTLLILRWIAIDQADQRVPAEFRGNRLGVFRE